MSIYYSIIGIKSCQIKTYNSHVKLKLTSIAKVNSATDLKKMEFKSTNRKV